MRDNSSKPAYLVEISRLPGGKKFGQLWMDYQFPLDSYDEDFEPAFDMHRPSTARVCLLPVCIDAHAAKLCAQAFMKIRSFDYSQCHSYKKCSVKDSYDFNT